MYSPGPKSPGAGAAPRPSFMLVRQSETFYTRTLELFLVSLSFYAHHKKPFIPRDYSLTFHLHQDLHSWYFCTKYLPHRVMIPLFFVYYYSRLCFLVINDINVYTLKWLSYIFEKSQPISYWLWCW